MLPRFLDNNQQNYSLHENTLASMKYNQLKHQREPRNKRDLDYKLSSLKVSDFRMNWEFSP
jgi:hypothetical protein